MSLPGHPQTEGLPSPNPVSSATGVPMASQPPSQHRPPPATPSASQPAAIQCASSSVHSSSKLPGSPSNLPKRLKANNLHMFLLCQPGRLQHPFWMTEASKVTPSDFKTGSRSSQALPEWSLQALKVTLAAPVYPNGAQCTAIVSKGIPKIHPK